MVLITLVALAMCSVHLHPFTLSKLTKDGQQHDKRKIEEEQSAVKHASVDQDSHSVLSTNDEKLFRSADKTIRNSSQIA